MSQDPFELDVRPLLHGGSDPFQAIMNAVDSLAPGQALKSPAGIRCSGYVAAQLLSSFIWVARRELESASRCVEKTFTRMPFTMMATRATERL